MYAMLYVVMDVVMYATAKQFLFLFFDRPFAFVYILSLDLMT